MTAKINLSPLVNQWGHEQSYDGWFDKSANYTINLRKVLGAVASPETPENSQNVTAKHAIYPYSNHIHIYMDTSRSFWWVVVGLSD